MIRCCEDWWARRTVAQQRGAVPLLYKSGLRAKRYRRRGERRRPRLLIGAPRRRFGAWPSRLNVRLLSDDIFCGMIGGRRKGPLSSSDVAVRTRIGGPKAGLGRRAAAKRATGLGGLIT